MRRGRSCEAAHTCRAVSWSWEAWTAYLVTAFFHPPTDTAMRKILLALGLCAIVPGWAQDWALFPLGTELYYSGNALPPDTTVELYLLDSVRNEGDEQVQLFNMQAWFATMGDCAASFADPIGLLGSLWPKDSLIVRNDTVFQYTAFGNAPFFFLPQAAIGQSWDVVSDFAGNDYDQITITCTAKEEHLVLGSADSVKIFTLTPNGASSGQLPISNFQMVLSKSHGLVEFVPFALFIHHPASVNFYTLQLTGAHGSNESAGFIRPGFNDFFHLQAGDALVWEYERYPADISQPWTHFYASDSITSSLITDDSVTYHVQRRQFNWTGELDTVLSLSFTGYLEQYKNLVDIGPDAITIASIEYGADPYFPGVTMDHIFFATDRYALLPALGPSGAVIGWGFGYAGPILNTENCLAIETVDIAYDARLDTWAGFNLVDWSDYFGIRRWTLIGSIIEGVPVGDLTLGLTKARAGRNGITTYPNPAHDRLFVNTADHLVASYVITDAQGREVQRGQLDADGIPVAALPNGLYLLRAQSGVQVLAACFIKE